MHSTTLDTLKVALHLDGTNVFVSGSRVTGRPPFLAEPSHTVLQHFINGWKGEGGGAGRASAILDVFVRPGLGADPEDVGLLPAFRSRACRGGETLPDGGSCRILDDNEIAEGLASLLVEGGGDMAAAAAGNPAPKRQDSEADQQTYLEHLYVQKLKRAL